MSEKTETELLRDLARRYCVLNAQKNAEPEEPQGHFVVVGGKNARSAKKLVEKVDWSSDLEAVMEELVTRVRSARAQGPEKLWVRAYVFKSTNPSEVLPLPGSSDSEDGGGADDDLPMLATSRVAELALSRIALRLIDKHVELVEYAHSQATDRRDELLAALGQVFEARVALAGEGGAYRAMADAAHSVAPSLEPMLKVLAGAALDWLAMQQQAAAPAPAGAAPEGPPPPPPTADESLAAAVAGVKAAAVRVVAAWGSASASARAAALQEAAMLRAMLDGLGAMGAAA